LKKIKISTLLVEPDQDSVVSHNSLKDICENISGCEHIVIPNAGYAAFREKMNEFLTILTGFVTRHC
jgi:pimeloyl-ACP methyl ester carboxylesterase